VKRGVFARFISTLACYLGLGVTGGAQGVGVATNRNLTIVALISVDLMFTAVSIISDGKWERHEGTKARRHEGRRDAPCVPSCPRAFVPSCLIPMSDIAIKVDSVTKIYNRRVILDAIRLDVRQGETLVILGGSGSGKSTLLRLMIGTCASTAGTSSGWEKALPPERSRGR